MRRRFAFTTLLVLGCGRPPAPEEPPATGPTADARPAADARPPLHFIDAGPVGAPKKLPAPIRLDVIAFDQTADGAVIVLGQSRSHPVQQGWKGYLINEHGKRVANSDFVITSVSDRDARAKVTMSPDQIEAAPRAVITGP